MSANRTRETTTTTGTGATITLNGAVAGHATYLETLTATTTNVFYTIEEGDDYEVGTGTFTSPNIFTRITAFEKKEGGAYTASPGTFLNLLGGAQIFIGIPAQEIDDKFSLTSDDTVTGDNVFQGSNSFGGDEFIKNAVDKIVASSADIVDISLYDTTSDTDGGAWRNKTSGTSWFQETLDTATRGSTRKFPEVALIVAETSTVTIYDAFDNDISMWMIFNVNFNAGSSRMAGYPAVTSIAALNGELLVGHAQVGNHVSSISRIDFIHDTAFQYTDSVVDYAGTNCGNWDTGISDRNDTSSTHYIGATPSSPVLIDDNVNSISVTNNSGAELDPNRFNLPYSTIEVMTDAGSSWINPDGSMANVDVVKDVTGAVSLVSGDIDASGLCVLASSADVYIFESVPIIDTALASADFIMNTSATTGPTVTGVITSVVINSSTSFTVGTSAGVFIVDYVIGAGENSVVTQITKDFNAPNQQGDVELSLSDSLTDRSVTNTTITDNGIAVISDIATGAEQKKITATGGTITAPVTTGGSIYGWEEIAGVMVFRAGTGWVGISEAAGTLTIADGTTFAMLRYTNGSGPSTAQYTKMEFYEKWITRENSNCLLAGTSNAISGISFDEFTEKLDAATGDGTSTFDKLQRIAYTDSSGTQTVDTMVAVSRVNDRRGIATTAESVFEKPQEEL